MQKIRILLTASFIVGALVVACGGSNASDGTPSGSTPTECSCTAGDPSCCAITLTPSEASATLTIPVVSPGNGYQKYTGIQIDATAFPSGGTIVVSGAAGEGCPVSLDLYPSSRSFPTEGTPTGQLADCWGNPGGKSFSTSYTFTAPTSFNLGATGSWDVDAGETNTVKLNIAISSTAAGDDVCGGGGGGGSGGCKGCTHDSDCGSCQRCQRSTCTCIARAGC